MEEEIQALKKENEALKLQVASLLAQQKVTTNHAVPIAKKEIKSVNVNGGYRANELDINTLVCFYELSGKTAGQVVFEGLKNLDNGVSWLSYTADPNFNAEATEKTIGRSKCVVLILSKDSLWTSEVVFIVKACSKYNIPIISVHDLASCFFPSPSAQPPEITQSGLFQDKAITFVKDYSDSVIQTIFKQISSKKQNFCVCTSPNIDAVAMGDIATRLQTIKYSKLEIETDSVSEAHYINHIRHTIQNCNTVLYVIDVNSIESRNFLRQVAKIAIDAKSRLYFIYVSGEVQTIESMIGTTIHQRITTFLQNQDIPIHQLSGMSWESDGLGAEFSEFGITITSPPKFADLIFEIPLNNGKWYYECEVHTNGLIQVGWANEFMDMSREGYGIGDDPHSYAFDGCRGVALPLLTYGRRWNVGDILGCMIDLDAQEISYSLNGEDFGVAFSNFRERNTEGNYVPYRPGISMKPNQQATLNFGSYPFEYLPQGYQGIQYAVPIGIYPEQQIQTILNAEGNYGNYDMHIPRTRAFLSHKRSSAQGVAGRIWQELKTDYNLFLDSEAQFDLHDLKLLAKHTGLFVFILSEGIFDSYWCLEELRSAIKCNRRVLLLQDYQFEIPTEFPPEMRDIQLFLASQEKILYMAEFFSECIKKIRTKLGPTDQELDSLLNHLNPMTKKCIIDDAFGRLGNYFIIANPLHTPFPEWYELINYHYEISSIKNVEFFEMYGFEFPMKDVDMDYFTKLMPNLLKFDVYLFDVFTDKSVEYLAERCPKLQILNLWGRGETSLTDKTLEIAARFKDLSKLILHSVANIENVENLQKTNLLELQLNGTNVADISCLPTSLQSIRMDSPCITSESAIAYFEKCSALCSVVMQEADFNDDVLIALLKNNKMIRTVNFFNSQLTNRCINTVPLPDSFVDLTVADSYDLVVPSGSRLVLRN